MNLLDLIEKAFHNGVYPIFTQTFDYHAFVEEPVKDCRKPFLLAHLEVFWKKTNLLLDKKIS
jgi:hypothetical protein